MTDSNLENRMTEMEQRQQRQDAIVAQIHELLLLSAQRHQESTQRHQESEQRLNRIEQTLDRVAIQQEINTREIAELRIILREQYRGNGQA